MAPAGRVRPGRTCDIHRRGAVRGGYGSDQRAVVNIVDAVLVALLGVFALRGYAKGLFREVFALLGLSVGFIVAVRYYDQASRWVDSWPYSPLILQILFFVGFFFLVYIGLNWVGHVLHRSADRFFLTGFNRLGGLLMGGSKGAVVLGIALFVVISQSWVPQNLQKPLGTAALVGPLYGFGAAVASMGASFTWPGALNPGSASPDSRHGA